jgi:hypothetical protein
VRSVPSNPLVIGVRRGRHVIDVPVARQTSHAPRTYDRNDISRLGPGGNVNGAMKGKEPSRVGDVSGAADRAESRRG